MVALVAVKEDAVVVARVEVPDTLRVPLKVRLPAVEDPTVRTSMYAVVVVALVAKRLVNVPVVLKRSVVVALVRVEEVAVRLLMVTEPVNDAESLKSERPLNTPPCTVGVMRDKLVAVPPVMTGSSMVVCRR